MERKEGKDEQDVQSAGVRLCWRLRVERFINTRLFTQTSSPSILTGARKKACVTTITTRYRQVIAEGAAIDDDEQRQ